MKSDSTHCSFGRFSLIETSGTYFFPSFILLLSEERELLTVTQREQHKS